MREIKFRAWDGHRMQTDFTLDSDDGMPRLTTYCIHGEPTEPVPHFKVMQFTGLRDKNGVDIYEGDILKDDSFEIYGCVYFNEKTASFCCDVMRFGGSEPCHVAGNIHQNPELLKGE